jgi:hypothetical protein
MSTNVRYNDQRVVRNYDRSDYNRAHYNTTRNHSAYQQRHVGTPSQQVTVSNAGRHGTNVKVVEKKEKKGKKHQGN